MVNPDRNLYEPPYDDALLYESDLEPERPRSRPLVVLLGIVVLAAFAGVVWVAYNQGIKHGQGVPTLVADSGPTRIAGDPNSSEATDVAPEKSYDRLLNPSAEPESENLLPQPEQPRTEPTEEVATSQPTNGAAVGGPKALVATDVAPPGGDPRMDSATGVPPSAIASGSPQAIVAAPPRGAPPASEDITSALPLAEVLSAKPAAPPKVALAPTKPTPAPVEPAVTELTTPEAAPPPAPASSGVMIQLGSFPNSELAASAWSKIKSTNQDLLGTYSPTIKPAAIEGKGTWYRLRVGGFADKAAAREVCDQLAASGQACIIAAK